MNNRKKSGVKTCSMQRKTSTTDERDEKYGKTNWNFLIEYICDEKNGTHHLKFDEILNKKKSRNFSMHEKHNECQISNDSAKALNLHIVYKLLLLFASVLISWSLCTRFFMFTVHCFTYSYIISIRTDQTLTQILKILSCDSVTVWSTN